MTADQAFEAFMTPPKMRELSRETEFLASASSSRRLRLAPGGLARGGGEEIQTYVWGDTGGPVALFVHGWGGRAAHFEGTIKRLVEAGWRVVAFDAPGHGRATGTLSSAPAIAASLLATVEGEGTFDAIIAHSLGAVATSIALRRGVVARRAVLLAACCRVEQTIRQFTAHLNLDDETARRMQVLAAGEFSVEESSTEENAPFLGGTSTLLLHDPADAEMPYAHSEAIAAAWPGAKLVPVIGVGHRRILRAKEIITRTCETVGA